jgi:hypothetical protein
VVGAACGMDKGTSGGMSSHTVLAPLDAVGVEGPDGRGRGNGVGGCDGTHTEGALGAVVGAAPSCDFPFFVFFFCFLAPSLLASSASAGDARLGVVGAAEGLVGPRAGDAPTPALNGDGTGTDFTASAGPGAATTAGPVVTAGDGVVTAGDGEGAACAPAPLPPLGGGLTT